MEVRGRVRSGGRRYGNRPGVLGPTARIGWDMEYDDMTLVSLPLYREPKEEKNDGSGTPNGDTGPDSPVQPPGVVPGPSAEGYRASPPPVQRERKRNLPDGRELPPRAGGWTGEHPVQRHRLGAHTKQRSAGRAFWDHLGALLLFSLTIPFVWSVQSVTLRKFGLEDFNLLQVAWTMYLLAAIKWGWGLAGDVRRGKA